MSPSRARSDYWPRSHASWYGTAAALARSAPPSLARLASPSMSLPPPLPFLSPSLARWLAPRARRTCRATPAAQHNPKSESSTHVRCAPHTPASPSLARSTSPPPSLPSLPSSSPSPPLSLALLPRPASTGTERDANVQRSSPRAARSDWFVGSWACAARTSDVSHYARCTDPSPTPTRGAERRLSPSSAFQKATPIATIN
ncbi:hypothetical protein B0H14DRAFT_1664376 [Mycena olivaceomarginata]|nr:hypothetical protein B0H14DRAFT_1664376 [Mycena olivaceomarginata]